MGTLRRLWGCRDDDLGTLGLDGGANGVALVAAVSDQLVEAFACYFDQRRAIVTSDRLPSEMSRMRGRPEASISAWILLVRPPREVPIP